MSTTNTNNAGELKRVVGVTGLALIVINITIGAGIYALPGIIGVQLGAAGIVGYILCGLMFATIILCYVEIGSRVKTSGGSYAYVESAFGPFAGFVVNWLFFFGWGALGSAALMNIMADSLTILFPDLANPIIRIVFLFSMIALMILVNVRDAKLSVRLVSIITILKLIPLLGIIIFGITHIDVSNLRWEQMPAIKSFGETALILFFAFAGFETSLNVSGEIKNPNRTIPRGILLGGILVLLIYILIQTVTVGVLGTHIRDFKDAPLAAVAETIVGATGVSILIFAAVLSCFGTVSGDVLASPRLLFAGANDGLFPKFLGKIHQKFGTPYWAVITYALLIFVFSVSGGFKQLAVLASGSLLLIYLAVILALIKFRMKKDETAEKTFKIPGGLLIPCIAIAAIIYVLSNLTKPEVFSISIFVTVVCFIYLVMKKLKKKT